MTEWASRSDVEANLPRWSDEQIACRSYQHRWNPLSVTHRPGLYTVTQRCTRCANTRQQDMDERGYPLTAWRMTYTDGYLLQNVGRVGADGRAALRLATLRNMQVVEVEDP